MYKIYIADLNSSNAEGISKVTLLNHTFIFLLILGLAHLLYKSNTKYGDVWVEVKLSVLERFVEAISERIMFITASYAKTKMAGFLPCFETLLSISSIVGKNISNLKEKLKL